MSQTITLVGSANIDVVMQMPRLPAKGETVSGGVFSQAFGGKGSNQAVAARRAGGKVHAVVSLGDDAGGRDFLDLLNNEGMDTTHARVQSGTASGTAMIQVDKDGNNTIAIAAGANDKLSPEQVEAARAAIAASRLLMLQMEIPDASIIRAIDIAAECGVPVMLNYAPCRASTVALTDKVTYLVVNETEAAALSGVAVSSAGDAEKAARALAEKGGHKVVIVTLGAEGCVVLAAGEAVRYPAFRITAVDATAAGDTFCGALAVALAEGRAMPEAIRFATAAGALSAGKLGAVPSIPQREEINAFLTERSGEGFCKQWRNSGTRS